MSPSEVARRNLDREQPLSPGELADLLSRRSASWVRRMIRKGKIQTLPCGTPYMIPASECRRLLSPITTEQTSQ